MTTVRVSWFSPAVNHCHNTSCTVWVGCSPWAIACELTVCYSTTLQIEKTHSTFALASRERTPGGCTSRQRKRGIRYAARALTAYLARHFPQLCLAVPANVVDKDYGSIWIPGSQWGALCNRHEWFSLRLHGKDSADSLCEQVVIWHHALMC
jgi:hypothetical protein